MIDWLHHNSVTTANPALPFEEYKKHKSTNYDLFISKTPKELAEWHCGLGACPPGKTSNPCIDEEYAYGRGPYVPSKKCHECWLEWLHQTSE